VLFVAGAVAASKSPYLPGDRELALWVQSVPLGQVSAPMDLTNWIGGSRQTALAIAIAVALALWRWRAGLLVALGIPASQIENLVKELTQRPRPSASLLQVREADGGFSYPSGHASFYTWLSVLVLVAIWPSLPARARPMAIGVAVVLIGIACTGRVWVGAHWPSDVAGGFLFGISWSYLAWLIWSRATRPAAAP
jgi:membrane-associated phospholipid phosphatase